MSHRQSRDLTRAERAARGRALRAVADMRREDIPPSQAVRQNGTTLRAVRRHLPRTLRRDSGSRRLSVTTGDNYGAQMEVLTTQGVRVLMVQGSHKRSTVGRHWAAVRRFLAEGERAEAELAGFSGATIAGHELLADPEELTDLGTFGELDEIDVYALGVAG